MCRQLPWETLGIRIGLRRTTGQPGRTTAPAAMASFNEDPADRAAELERMLVGHDCTLETAFGFIR